MKSELEATNLLELAPVRIARWEARGDRVEVVRPLPRGWGPRSLVYRLSFHLSVKRVRLDELSSFAWHRLDGARTVAEVAGELRAEFGESAEPAEERLGKFVRMLRQEGMLGYPGWDETESETKPE